MGRQSRLVLLLLLSIGVFQVTLTSTPHQLNVEHDDNINDNHLSSGSAENEIPNINNVAGVKISTPKEKEVPMPTTASTNAKKSMTTTHKPLSDEILNDLIEASKHSVALADDPRFNKMLPEKYKLENTTSTNSNKSEEAYDEYDNYDYDEDYNYDEDTTSPEPTKKSKSTTAKPKATEKVASKLDKKIEMKPIKEDVKVTSKSKVTHKNDENQTNNIDELDDDDEYDDDDDDEDDDDDIADEEEIVFSENVPCPRYCVCARNINNYLVATCSRFDPETQKFGTDITDLIVTDVGPKYPILLGPEFFLQMGLKHVSSIKIANCTIEYLHPDAFHGLDELYSVNLTNVGLAIINPDTFVKNKKLRMLTISGNDLSIMSSVHYILKSSTIEELDLSRNNLMELNQNAFSQLKNIVYINLSQNNLQKLPEKVFENSDTIEELDLSYNSLKTLPQNIFKNTQLAILNLKYNSITGNLHFCPKELQQLDLSFNSINTIHHGMFDTLIDLTNLNLKGNGITKVQADSFLSLKRLRNIDLSINELDQVSSMMFYKNSELDVIRLNDNPRLSQLPTDGILSYNGYFNVYYMDISNCAIGALGHKTFSTMPHLSTLKLAWNNINNLERDTFSRLTKLIDLDLSNNLISHMDELMFMNNNELTKLNLAGNPIRKLSIRLFLPLSKLRELDVSDCELNSLLADNQFGVGRKYKFYETLRSFNASANQIRRISSADVKNFKNLRTLDVSNNPLKCNEDFQDFISWVSLNSKMIANKVPTMANLESATTFVEFQPHAGWAELARDVCKHHESLKPKGNKFEKRIQQVDKDLDEDTKNLMNIMENSKLSKLQKILQDSRKSEVVIDDHSSDSLDEDANENDLDNAEEEKDSDEENESDYNEEDDDEDDEDDDVDEEIVKKENKKNHNDITDSSAKRQQKIDSAKLNDFGLKVEEVELDKDVKDKFLLNKFLLSGEESQDDSDEEEIIIQRGHVYYTGYRFLIPIIVVVLCVLIILLAIGKIVAMVLRKRGERYRMALLASSNNSIVYQKLSEEIKPKPKEVKQPKVHRYSPINQV